MNETAHKHGSIMTSYHINTPAMKSHFPNVIFSRGFLCQIFWRTTWVCGTLSSPRPRASTSPCCGPPRSPWMSTSRTTCGGAASTRCDTQTSTLDFTYNIYTISICYLHCISRCGTSPRCGCCSPPHRSTWRPRPGRGTRGTAARPSDRWDHCKGVIQPSSCRYRQCYTKFNVILQWPRTVTFYSKAENQNDA